MLQHGFVLFKRDTDTTDYDAVELAAKESSGRVNLILPENGLHFALGWKTDAQA